MGTNKTPPKGLALRKKPRLTAMERLAIETGLDAGKTPYAIAQELGRPPKTVDLRARLVLCKMESVCGGEDSRLLNPWGVCRAVLSGPRRRKRGPKDAPGRRAFHEPITRRP